MIHSPLPIALIGTGIAATAISAYTAYGTFVPRGQLWGPVVWKGSSDGPGRVALTFDDGPTAGATDRVLDLLAELNVKAAFFLIGRNVEREPDLARRIVADGHLVGNHTYDHSRWSALRRK
jgi:peptidoglycan/xylan/chitin deacetylase (PgdA/CDA1 family)